MFREREKKSSESDSCKDLKDRGLKVFVFDKAWHLYSERSPDSRILENKMKKESTKRRKYRGERKWIREFLLRSDRTIYYRDSAWDDICPMRIPKETPNFIKEE